MWQRTKGGKVFKASILELAMESYSSYNSDLPRLYIAKIENSPVPGDNYVYYHEWETGAGIFPYEGVNMEYLQGYLEGATTHQWNKLIVENGIPEKHFGAFEGLKVVPLDKDKLEDLLDGTTLRSHYPHLPK